MFRRFVNVVVFHLIAGSMTLAQPNRNPQSVEGFRAQLGVPTQVEIQQSPSFFPNEQAPEIEVVQDEPKKTSKESLEKRVMELESQLNKLQEKSSSKSEPIETEKKPSRPTLKFTGRVHADHWSFPRNSPGIGFFENPATGVDPEDRVFFRRLRLEMQGDAFEFFTYRMQVDFNNPRTPEIKDAYIGFKNVPILQTVLVGNQKRPLGLDHLTSSRFTVFIERPLVVEAFNEDARRLGIASYSLTEDEKYTFRFGAYLLENIPTTGRYIGDSAQGSFNARLSSSPWYDYENDGRNYFHWAVAGMVARPDGDVDPRDSNRNEGRFRTRSELRSDLRWLDTGRIPGAQWYEILALETIFNLGPFQIVGEYQTNWMQRDSFTPGTGPDLHFHGGYVYLAYFLTGEHMPYNRKIGAFGRVRPKRNLTFGNCFNGEPKGWGAWQVAYRYSFLDLTSNDILGGVNHNHTLALVWYMNPHTSFQVNTVYGDIHDHRPQGGFTSGNFWAVGTRFRIDF